MKLSLRHSLFVTALAALLAATGAARAAGYLDPVVDTSVPGGAAGQLQPFVSITPVYQGNADLDSGGDFSARGVILRGGAAYDFGGGTRAGRPHPQLRLPRLLVLESEFVGADPAVGHRSALRLQRSAVVPGLG